MEGGGCPPKRRKVETGITNLQLFKGLSRDRVLRRRFTGPLGSEAPHVHRGTRRIFRFAGKCTGTVSPPFRQRPGRQRTAILLLFVSNPNRRHRHLRTVLPVLLQTETSRNGAAGHSERLFHR